MDEGSRDGKRSAGSTPGLPRVTGKVIRADAVDLGVGAERLPPPPPPRRAVVNAEEFEAHQAAKGIVAEAMKKADEIRAEALRYKEEVFAKARDDARAEVEARSAEELARAKMLAGQLLQDSEKDIVELALRVAERIIGNDLERDPEVVLSICANAIQSTRAQKAMTLRVNPEDGRVLREKRPKLFEMLGRSVDLAVRDDADIERGGCIIQTEYGTIDGQIRTQFEMLRNVLLPDTGKKEAK